MTLWVKVYSEYMCLNEAIEQYFPVVLFIMLYKVGLTFESINEILQCDYLEERW